MPRLPDENDFVFRGIHLVARPEGLQCCEDCYFWDEFGDSDCVQLRLDGDRPGCIDCHRTDGHDVVFVRANIIPKGPHKTNTRGLALPLPK